MPFIGRVVVEQDVEDPFALTHQQAVLIFVVEPVQLLAAVIRLAVGAGVEDEEEGGGVELVLNGDVELRVAVQLPIPPDA